MAQPIEGGKFCPKCGRRMQRYRHEPSWSPKSNWSYYFAHWDRCRPCRHMQNYEAAKIWRVDNPSTISKGRKTHRR
jgi:hypothetical protein